MSEQARLGSAIKTISETYLGRVITAGDSRGIVKWATRLADYATRLAALASPPLTRAEAADLDEPDASIDLSVPSNDTVVYLNQWLAAREHPDAVPAGSLFARNGDGDIVQLVANIVGHGTAYHAVGDVSSETLDLARMLNEGNRFGLMPLFLASLASGEPEFARSLGVHSESVVGGLV